MATTTDRAAEIRAELKARGWSSRAVSVKSDYFAGGSSIDVRIKDGSVPIAVVRSIAEAHERIDRCAITGDILSGCNRYVSVSYTGEALAAIAAPLVPQVTAALASLKAGGTTHAEIPGTDCTVSPDGTGWGVAVWGPDRRIGSFDRNDAQGVAACIALR